ncbi:hypothetical protein GSI_14343 [Ganoderma sinense ZZ0214-1]|uniref:DUF6699 domain-containing protein n=1 Tax=Ganoderma sinense ZZ0214-1 TaxID=1077348 RepID=A0A2G8RNE7_9APHY|nr:hypothetical protein GSI_14343 [Ganoderma sinense ZZ0214-1]
MERTAKKVRFANVPPQTPSPASSSASLGSSPGPSTPPQLPSVHLPPMVVRPPEYPQWQQRVSPPLVIPPPPRYPAFTTTAPENDPVVDPLLAAPLYRSHPPPLRWDVMQHPNSIKLGGAGSPQKRELSHEDLARCAVRTSAKGSPLLLRRIVLIFPGLPLEIEVNPADSPVWTATPLPYLTVGDVLYGLYKALRTSVAPREFDGLEPGHRELMNRAFKKRLRGDPEHHDKNVRHGVRRIDYLGEARQFTGLRPAGSVELSPGRRLGEVFVVQLAPVR